MAHQLVGNIVFFLLQPKSLGNILAWSSHFKILIQVGKINRSNTAHKIESHTIKVYFYKHILDYNYVLCAWSFIESMF